MGPPSPVPRDAAPSARPVPRGAPAGYTLIELLICLALVAALAALSGPVLARLRGAHAVRGARAEVIATIEAARAAALQRGRPASVQVRGDTMRAVVIEVVGAPYVVVATADLRREYGARLATGTPADTLVSFDARGLASPRLGRVARYVVRAESGSARDSVCVSNLGLLLPPGCAP